jgi:hypothetical protein
MATFLLQIDVFVVGLSRVWIKRGVMYAEAGFSNWMRYTVYIECEALHVDP